MKYLYPMLLLFLLSGCMSSMKRKACTDMPDFSTQQKLNKHYCEVGKCVEGHICNNE